MKEIYMKINKITSKKYFWVVVFGVQMLLEYLLFRSYALREAVDKVPQNMDQSFFLSTTYANYFNWLRGDYWAAIENILFKSNNSAAPALNAILLYIFGYSRYSLLLFNFFALVIAQFGGGYLVYKYTGNRKIQCIYNGMILMLNTHFIFAGDLLDYRMDYMAAFLFMVFILSWAIWLVKEEKIFFLIAALISGSAVLVRFNVVVYVVLVVVISEAIRLLFRNSTLRKSILSIVNFGVLCVIGGGWSVLTNFNNFFYYYFTYHTGEMAAVWEYEGTILEQIKYYPDALINMHIGKSLFYIGVLIIVVTIIKSCFMKYKINKNVKIAICSLTFVLLMQLIILTMDRVKVNTTASIMVGIWITIVVLLINELQKNKSSKKVEYAISFLVVLVLVLGVTNYVQGTTKKHYVEYDNNIDDIYAAVDEYILDTDKNSFVYLMDSDGTFDLLQLYNFKNYQYEKNSKDISLLFPSMIYNWGYDENGFGVDEVLVDVDKCDIIIISQNGFKVRSADYSLNSSWENARLAIWNKLQNSQRHIKLIETDIDGYPVAVFGKKIADYSLSGVDSDGWTEEVITITNYDSDYDLCINFQRSALEFIGESGNTIQIYINDELINTVFVECAGEIIHLNDLLGEKTVQGDNIQLKIESQVCPKEKQLGDDERNLGILLDIY